MWERYTDVLASTIINELEMEIAENKATLITNDSMLGKQAAQLLGKFAGKVGGASVRRLGVDHSLTETNPGAVFRHRLAKCFLRKGLVKKLKRAKLSHKVWKAAMMPSLLYGVEVSCP